MKRKRKTYHLYIWTTRGMPAGQKIRGRRVESFFFYMDLVHEAKRRTRIAGYPVSKWMDLYDWNVQ